MLSFLFFSILLLSSPVLGLSGLKDPPDPILYAVVECTTSIDPSQPIVIEVYTNWSPLGAKRFIELVNDGYYDDSPIFRVAKVCCCWGLLFGLNISFLFL